MWNLPMSDHDGGGHQPSASPDQEPKTPDSFSDKARGEFAGTQEDPFADFVDSLGPNDRPRIDVNDPHTAGSFIC